MSEDADILRTPIADALRQAGHDDLAAHAERIARRIDAAEAAGAHSCVRPVVYDRHGILAAHPGLRRGLDRWIADPAPRLPGLRIRVREDATFAGPPAIEFRMTHAPGAGPEWHAQRLISGVDLGLPLRGEAVTYDVLEGLHWTIVDHLRGSAVSPAT